MAKQQIIKFEGLKSDLVWKYPKKEFDRDAIIDIPASFDCMIYFSDYEEYIPSNGGRQVPISDKKSFFGKKKKLDQVKIYYIRNTDVEVYINWGTPNRVTVTDNRTKTPFDIGAFGRVSYKMTYGKKLIEKVVGHESIFTDGNLRDLVLGHINSSVREAIATTNLKSGIDVFNLSTCQKDIRDLVRKDLLHIFDEKGLELKEFIIESINISEENKQTILTLLNEEAKERLHHEEETQKTTVKFCPVCGEENDADALFCKKCGERIG